MTRPAFTLGVEEEFHLVEPATGEPSSTGSRVLSDVESSPRFTGEILESMVETASDVHDDLGALREDLAAARRQLAASAADAGRWLVAAGTLPTGVDRPDVSDSPRYRDLVALHGLVAREQLVCGCHVHIGVEDRETALQVANRMGPWLPTLLALSSSSPFWRGTDSGYSSYRTIVWGRWPSAAPYPGFADVDAYEQRIAALLELGVIRDRGQVYWDLRLSDDHPTLELRVADVCTTVDEAVLQAALGRALARTAWQELQDGVAPPVADVLGDAARWLAARYGTSGRLVDPVDRRPRRAADVIDRLVRHVADALDADGCREEVLELITRVQRDGTSADIQRAQLRRHGDLHRLVSQLASRTASA